MPHEPISQVELSAIALQVREAYQQAVAETREMAQRMDERSRARAQDKSSEPQPRQTTNR